ncbi:MAG TPA: helix-turn-helix domain-containing protein, partial [Candidatus Dormibacteraeota bacterium]|nr:helix-turn-helix domain-containing protein [Candidatus Dormibacteraeota bacterium]
MAHVDHFEATRSRLLRLAGDLFARRGYAGVSMRDVAVAAGVTKPALYYHFRDKDALFTECLLTQQGALGRLVDAAIASPAAIEDRVSFVAEIL